MIISTTNFIANHRVVETKGQVFGVVVRSRGLAGNIAAGLRSLAGGEIREYTELLEDARRHAIDRMVQNAAAMGANAILSMRFDSSEMASYMTEIVAYGTAVVIAPGPSAYDAPASGWTAQGGQPGPTQGPGQQGFGDTWSPGGPGGSR